MTAAPPLGEQLEFALEPHDGTPLSFLKALRAQLDRFNPDRAQIEGQRYRPAIVTALQKLRAHSRDNYGAARALFPGIGTVPDVAVSVGVEDNGLEEGLCASCLAGQEPRFPVFMPTMAPDARRARGTPVSAPPLELFVSCNRGLTPCPTSMPPRAVSGAFVFGIQSNQALA